MLSAEQQYRAISGQPFLFELQDRPILRISGGDALRYLHARLTQDVQTLATGAGAKALILSPQGRIQGQLLLFRRADDFVAISLGSSDAGGSFESALMAFKVADRVEVTPVSTTVFSLQGAGAGELLQRLGVSTLPAQRYHHVRWLGLGADVTIVRHERGTAEGFDLFSAADFVPALRALLVAHGIEHGSDACLEMLRISAAIPEYGRDLSEQISAGEIDLADYASFTKGCYTGQEAVEMTAARGRPNRQLRLFSCTARASLPAQSPIVSTAGGSQPIGFITSSALFAAECRVLALGFVKSGVQPPYFVGAAELTLTEPCHA